MSPFLLGPGAVATWALSGFARRFGGCLKKTLGLKKMAAEKLVFRRPRWNIKLSAAVPPFLNGQYLKGKTIKDREKIVSTSRVSEGISDGQKLGFADSIAEAGYKSRHF